MADEKSKLLTKVSPLIEGQVPDFIQADHPIFVKFLKEYYKFLEAGQVTYEVVNSYVRFETTTTAYVLDEVDGDRILTEDTAKFTNGEIITGNTSGATATILVEDSRNSYIYITGQQLFENGETVFVYDTQRDGTGSPAAANGYNAVFSDTGANVVFATVPAAVTSNTSHGALAGTLNEVEIGGIRSIQVLSSGQGYTSIPVVEIANTKIESFGNAPDKVGALSLIHI